MPGASSFLHKAMAYSAVMAFAFFVMNFAWYGFEKSLGYFHAGVVASVAMAVVLMIALLIPGWLLPKDKKDSQSP